MYKIFEFEFEKFEKHLFEYGGCHSHTLTSHCASRTALSSLGLEVCLLAVQRGSVLAQTLSCSKDRDVNPPELWFCSPDFEKFEDHSSDSRPFSYWLVRLFKVHQRREATLPGAESCNVHVYQQENGDFWLPGYCGLTPVGNWPQWDRERVKVRKMWVEVKTV